MRVFTITVGAQICYIFYHSRLCLCMHEHIQELCIFILVRMRIRAIFSYLCRLLSISPYKKRMHKKRLKMSTYRLYKKKNASKTKLIVNISICLYVKKKKKVYEYSPLCSWVLQTIDWLNLSFTSETQVIDRLSLIKRINSMGESFKQKILNYPWLTYRSLIVSVLAIYLKKKK